MLQKSGRLVLWEAMFILELHSAETQVHLLEQMLEALTTHWSLTDSVLYHRMAPETKAIQSHELIPVLLNGLETDPQCAYLREHPKFREIIDKYKNK